METSKFVCLFVLIIYVFDREKQRGNMIGGSGQGRIRLPAEQGACCKAPSQDPGILT